MRIQSIDITSTWNEDEYIGEIIIKHNNLDVKFKLSKFELDSLIQSLERTEEFKNFADTIKYHEHKNTQIINNT